MDMILCNPPYFKVDPSQSERGEHYLSLKYDEPEEGTVVLKYSQV